MTLTHTALAPHRRLTGSSRVCQGRFKSFPMQSDEHDNRVARANQRVFWQPAGWLRNHTSRRSSIVRSPGSSIGRAASRYNALMSTPPTRRWFQFRLRTLLVGVVLIGSAFGYVVHETRIVAARKEWLATHLGSYYRLKPLAAKSGGADISMIRRILGDEPRDFISVSAESEIPIAHGLFPEAVIAMASDDGNDWIPRLPSARPAEPSKHF